MPNVDAGLPDQDGQRLTRNHLHSNYSLESYGGEDELGGQTFPTCCKEVWEALHPEPSVDYGREDGEKETGGPTRPTSLDTLPDGRKKGPQHHQSFAAATAEVTGQSKRDINRNLARAEAIGDDLLRLKGTCLDKGVELDALAHGPANIVTVTKRYSRGILGRGAMRAR